MIMPPGLHRRHADAALEPRGEVYPLLLGPHKHFEQGNRRTTFEAPPEPLI